MVRSCALVVVLLVVLVMVPVAVGKVPKNFANCTAVEMHYPHGVAKNAKSAASADGTTGRPFISSKFYGLYGKRLDRDHDGVFCEW